MSGFCGIYYLNGKPVGHVSMESMLGKIRHRGRDGEGIWCSGPVGLAHCMHWTTPESIRERQPILSSQADSVLVADARVDNRDALIKGLSITRRPAREITDGQLILKAYQEWGEACAEKLEGDFAFAIWDAKRQRLFCARDTAGVKPFYYYASPSLIVIASEIKALLALPDIPRKLNERKIADFLLWSFEDTVETFYQGIFRLPPASCLVIDSEGLRLRQYWSLDPCYEIHFKKDEEYVQAFQEIFTQAVGKRLRSAFPLGTTLSGGLDSSSIACTARRLNSQKNSHSIPVFSVTFTDKQDQETSSYDEKLYIDRVLASGGFDSHFISGSGLIPLIENENLWAILDEPYFSPTLFIFWELYRVSKENCLKVLLDGTDGDSTVFHGLNRLADLAQAGRWWRLWKEAKYLTEFQYPDRSVLPLIWQYGFQPLIPDRLAMVKRHWTNQGEENQEIIRPEFARRVGYSDKLRIKMRNTRIRHHSAREGHWRELTSGLNALSLELVDKASAVFSLELRFPFYDQRLIEYCLALPSEWKLHNGWTRYILRTAMQGILPEEVRWRTGKANLVAAFLHQFNLIKPSSLGRLASESSKLLNDYVNRSSLEMAYANYQVHSSNQLVYAYTLFGVITLANWLQNAGFD